MSPALRAGQGLLGHILGLGVVVQHAPRQRQDCAYVSVGQGTERVAVVACYAREQNTVLSRIRPRSATHIRTRRGRLG